VVAEKNSGGFSPPLHRLRSPPTGRDRAQGLGDRHAGQKRARWVTTHMGLDLLDHCGFGSGLESVISLLRASGAPRREQRPVWVSHAPPTGFPFVLAATGIEGAVPLCTDG
jgi:hypothetical protein